RADEDADISAAYGIPALLNYEDAMYGDGIQGLAADSIATGADMQVPGYHGSEMIANHHGSDDVVVVNGTAVYEGGDFSQEYQQQQQQQQQTYLGHQTISEAPHMAYNASGSRHDSVTAPTATISAAAATASTNNGPSVAAAPHTYSMSAAGMNNPNGAQTHYNDTSYQKPHYYDAGTYKASASSGNIADMQHKSAANVDTAAGYPYGGNSGAGSKRQRAYGDGRADDYHASSGYYEGSTAAGGSAAPPVPASNGYPAARENVAYDYEGNAPAKRQRVVQPSTTWPGSPSQYQQQSQQYAYQQESQEWQEQHAPGFGKNGYQATDPESALPPHGYGRHEEQHHRIYKGASGDSMGAAPATHQSQYHSQGQLPRDNQQPYHYGQPNPDYHRPGASSAYYDSQKYDYPTDSAAYYHQQQMQQRFYQAQENMYYQAPSHYQQQAQPSKLLIYE
ncbi:hypothetical protein GGI05_005109, partial [Coemansia sp. RSA 2603]